VWAVVPEVAAPEIQDFVAPGLQRRCVGFLQCVAEDFVDVFPGCEHGRSGGAAGADAFRKIVASGVFEAEANFTSVPYIEPSALLLSST